MADHKKSAGKFVLAGLLGAVAGAIGGLLFAPQSGKETREDIAELANKITKQVKTGVTDTKDKVKEVFGNASEEAMDKYKEIRGKIVDKVAALKTVGNEINKEKYGEIVENIVDEFKSDFSATKNGAMKMANQMKKDWEKVKKVLLNA
jgi:gas vesicle protein